MLREQIQSALKTAMKERQTTRLATLRLVSAAIKDRDIAARGDDGNEGVTDKDILAILDKMIRQREDSASAYEEGGRLELAEQERAEIEVISEFLPRRLSAEETDKAIDTAISTLGADSIRDMGRVMAHLKERYAGQIDFAKVGPQVKDRLCA